MTMYGKHQPQKDWIKAGSFCLFFALVEESRVPGAGTAGRLLVLCDWVEKLQREHLYPGSSLR